MIFLVKKKQTYKIFFFGQKPDFRHGELTIFIGNFKSTWKA
jgi:hypothetical protein